MASVSAIPDGKEKNVHCVMTNVKWPIAMGTGIVSAANVSAYEATKGNYVKKVRIENIAGKSSQNDESNLFRIFIFLWMFFFFCFGSRLSASNMFWARLLR